MATIEIRHGTLYESSDKLAKMNQEWSRKEEYTKREFESWRQRAKSTLPSKYSSYSLPETNPCQPYCCCDVEKYKWCIMVGIWLGFGIVFNLALHLLPKLF